MTITRREFLLARYAQELSAGMQQRVTPMELQDNLMEATCAFAN